jgi:hypothetical protein
VPIAVVAVVRKNRFSFTTLQVFFELQCCLFGY